MRRPKNKFINHVREINFLIGPPSFMRPFPDPQNVNFTQVFQCFFSIITILHRFFKVFYATCQFYICFSMFSVPNSNFTQVFQGFLRHMSILHRFFKVFCATCQFYTGFSRLSAPHFNFTQVFQGVLRQTPILHKFFQVF